MMDFLEDVDLLKDFLPWETIFHVRFIKAFNSYLLTCQLMYSEAHFSKGAFPNLFYKFIVLSGSLWYCTMLLNMGSYSFDQSFFFLKCSGIRSQCRPTSISEIIRWRFNRYLPFHFCYIIILCADDRFLWFRSLWRNSSLKRKGFFLLIVFWELIQVQLEQISNQILSFFLRANFW